MEFWEFLIQKEGDRSWLPLESPSVEILEGRYRVVARSDRANTATEIRVTHYATTETPPVRRVRKRSSRTNADGLVVILPFTRLQPGLWELRCTGDVMAEMMGENWQYAVRLDVVPQSESPSDEWDPDWQGNVTAAEGIAEAVNRAELEMDASVEASSPELAETAELTAVVEQTEVEPTQAGAVDAANSESDADCPTANLSASSVELSQVLQQVEQASEQLVDSIFQDLGDLTSEAASSSAIGAEPENCAEPTPQLQVILEQETFVIQRGESLTLTGRVEFLADPPPAQTAISELRVRLYDPQTSALLMDEVYPIDNRVPPFPFSGRISLPEHYQTYLVLGELIFQGPSSTDSLQVLATRSFNVTTDLHELIESIANDFPDVEALPAGAMPVIAEPLPTAELNRLNASKPLQRSSQPLPPQLRPTDPTRTHASLQLPSFAQPATTASPESLSSSAEAASVSSEAQRADKEKHGPVSTTAADLLPKPPISEQTPPEPSTPEQATPNQAETDHEIIELPAELPAQLPTETASETGELETALAPQDPSDLFLNWDELGSRVPIWRQRKPRPADLSNAPEDISFRALNLQNRFLQRLQSLATNPDLAATLGAFELVEPPSSDLRSYDSRSYDSRSSDLQSSDPQDVTRYSQSLGLDADLAVHEIVVEDELARTVNQTDAAPEPEPLPGPLLPEDEPIPMPRLQLPTGEMIAGQPFLVTVKLPNLLARVYVKLWLRDRQTRDLIGTPRWIIDFVPDGFGNQMARTEVIVPPGSLKVQFEAIAVEIATQRESDKVTLTRPIVPPDLSPLSLDGLEI